MKTVIQPATTVRTEAEMKLAHQELADFFHPRKTYRPCDECGKEDFHAVTCSVGRTRFQGWSTNIHEESEVGGPCDKNGCTLDATMRIRLNIWGSLYEFYVCQAHGQNSDGTSRDGCLCDSL
jgi:hypothetical protein